MPTLPGPAGPIPYTRDALGYPRLVARDRVEAAWARGWFHGTDRLATAQLTVRIARGELMSVVGDEPLPRLVDRFVRMLDFTRDLDEQAAAVTGEARAAMEAYCAGFNAAAEARGRPWILRLMGLEVEPWSIGHVLLTYRLLSFFGLTSMQLSAELTVLELVADGASERLLHLLLGEAADALDREELGDIELPAWLRLLRLGFVGGSNAVAVAPSRSASGSALLEGDPHLEIGRFPPLGYAVHCEILGGAGGAGAGEDPAAREYIQGVGVVGWPFLTSGRNPRLAWSYTYAHADHVDVLVEECQGGRVRRAGDTWHPLTRRTETVKIRGRKAPESWTFWDSPYGTILGDAGSKEPVRLPCVRWMGLRGSGHDLVALWEAVSSPDPHVGIAKHREVRTVAVALVAAHADGTIASVQTGTVDRRPEGWNGTGPWPGWTLQDLAPEPLSESSRPCEVDPEGGIFVSANVRHDSPDGALWCTLPEPRWRFERLHQLLEGRDDLTLRDLARAVYDQHDLAAEAFVPLWAPLLPQDPEVGRLQAWASTQPQPPREDDRRCQALFWALHTELVRALLARELDDERADRFVDELSLGLMFQHQLDPAFALERPELLDEAGLRSLLAEAWPRALARAASADWWLPMEEPFKNLFTLGKEPAFLGLSTRAFPWPGGPVSPLQARVMTLGGERMPGGPGWRVLFDLGKHGGWYNIAGGASERRFGPGYGEGLDSWREGRFLPLGDPEGEPPDLG